MDPSSREAHLTRTYSTNIGDAMGVEAMRVAAAFGEERFGKQLEAAIQKGGGSPSA